MKKFEYLHERRVPKSEGMNKLGAEGWKMLGVWTDKCIFIREVEPNEKEVQAVKRHVKKKKEVKK